MSQGLTRAALGSVVAAGALLLAGSVGAATLPVPLPTPTLPTPTQPAATITGGPTGSVTATTATFTFTTTQSDPVASFQCRLDGGPWSACASPKAYAGLIGGPHTFAVRLQGLLVDQTPATQDWAIVVDTVAAPRPLRPRVVTKSPPRARPTERRDSGGCAYGANRAGEVSAAHLRRAVICLINRVRARHGLRPVHENDDLDRAAASHVRDMIARGYFSHYTPAGLGPGDRIRRTGYLAHAGYWAIGEILAWTQRPTPTPQAAVAEWMNSPPHRAIILTGAYRDIGASALPGAPRRGVLGAGTFAGEFGRRH